MQFVIILVGLFVLTWFLVVWFPKDLFYGFRPFHLCICILAMYNVHGWKGSCIVSSIFEP